MAKERLRIICNEDSARSTKEITKSMFPQGTRRERERKEDSERERKRERAVALHRHEDERNRTTAAAVVALFAVSSN